MKRYPIVQIVVLSGLTVWPGLVFAADAAAPAPPVPNTPAAGAATDAAQIRDIMRKRFSGQPLTAEEQALMDKATVTMAGRATARNRFGGAQANDAEAIMQDLNVLDRASIWTAYALSQATKRDEAQALLNTVVTKSPDKAAVSLAQWELGKVQQDKGELGAAEKTFYSVSGRAAPLALDSLFEPLVKASNYDGLISAYKQLSAAQTTDLDRCRLVKALMEQIEQPALTVLPFDKRAALVQAASEGLTYDQAVAARDVLAKEKTGDALAPQSFARFGNNLLNGGGMLGGGGLGGLFGGANGNAGGQGFGRGRRNGGGNNGGGGNAPAAPNPAGDANF